MQGFPEKDWLNKLQRIEVNYRNLKYIFQEKFIQGLQWFINFICLCVCVCVCDVYTKKYLNYTKMLAVIHIWYMGLPHCSFFPFVS